jgi:hypothetical protein
MVWPARFARMPYKNVNNILLMKIGHLQTLYDLQEVEIVLRALLIAQEQGQSIGRKILRGQGILERRRLHGGDDAYEEFVTVSD